MAGRQDAHACYFSQKAVLYNIMNLKQSHEPRKIIRPTAAVAAAIGLSALSLSGCGENIDATAVGCHTAEIGEFKTVNANQAIVATMENELAVTDWQPYHGATVTAQQANEDLSRGPGDVHYTYPGDKFVFCISDDGAITYQDGSAQPLGEG